METLSDDGSREAPLGPAPRGLDEREERMMTMEELKQEMFKSLKDTGTIEAIRAQLRRRFIEKLKMHGRNIRRASDEDGNNDEDEEKQTWSVDQQLVHGLVHEYLQHHKMEHTTAVFVPEIGGMQQLLSRDAIAQMLRLEDAHMRSIGDIDNQETPLVTVLLKELTRRLAVATMSSLTQTAMDCHDHRLALENQLRRVENTYLAGCASHKADYSAKSFEERVLRYQREYDEMCEKRLKGDLERFKATELGLMRVEERRKFEREMDATKATMVQEHRERLQRLQDRERELEMEFAARKAELESSLFEARQVLFQDIEKLRVKQQDVEAKYNSETRHLTMETKRLQLLEEAIRAREDNMQSTVDSMLREKEKAWQLEKLKWESDTKARERQLLAQEQDLEDDRRAVNSERDAIKATRKTIGALESELVSLQDALSSVEKKLSKAEAQKKALAREIEAREELLGEDKHNLKTLSYENARLTAELKAVQGERSKLEDAVVEKISEAKQLEAELKDMQHQFIQLKLSEANGIVEERKRLIQILETERADSRWKENELIGRLRELQTRLAESEAAVEKYQTQYEDEKVHVEALRHEVASLHTLLAQAQSAVSSRQHVGGRSASQTRSSNGGDSSGEMSERMLMRMMEMVSQIANMQNNSSSGHPRELNPVTWTTQPQSARSGDDSQTIDSLRKKTEEEEAAKLKREQERLEREILEQRDAERKRREREEAEQRDMEERRKKFEEELDLERQQRAKYEEDMEAERKRRFAEQEAQLQAELEKQQKALDEAREVQKRFVDEQIAAEQRRLQQERYLEEERCRIEKEKVNAERLLLLRQEEGERERHRELVVSNETTTDEDLPSDSKGNLPTGQELSVDPLLPQGSGADQREDSQPSLRTDGTDDHHLDTHVMDNEGRESTELKTQAIQQSDCNSEQDSFHSDAEASDNECSHQREISTDIPVVDNEVDRGGVDKSPGRSGEGLSRIQANPLTEGEGVGEVEREQADEPTPVIVKTEEELEQERRQAAEEVKKKEDDNALDVYRQRVLARRAADKQRQQEVEDQRKREEEERAAAEQASLKENASDDEMENSGGSFASSAASSSGSF